MHFARLRVKYLYSLRRHPRDWANWHGEANIGDAIQCLAVENLYSEMGVSPERLLLIARDAIDRYDGEPCIAPMQGWFGYFADIFPFPWTEKIIPFFSGFHLTSTWESRERFAAAGMPGKMRPFQPIGCRDRGTMRFLRSQGLDAYLSGCLTLTFPRREAEPENGRIFIVDLDEEIRKRIPPAITSQADAGITHFHYFSSHPVDDRAAADFELLARRILERYRREARLVVTSRLHAALPCLAMGIPVVFINEQAENERFDALRGLLPAHRPEDIGEINWNPPQPEVEPLKAVVKQTFFSLFRTAAEKHGLEIPIMPNPAPAEIGSFEAGVDRRELYDSLSKSRRLDELERQIGDLERHNRSLRDGIGGLRTNSLFLRAADWGERLFCRRAGIRKSLKALRRLAAEGRR